MITTTATSTGQTGDFHQKRSSVAANRPPAVVRVTHEKLLQQVVKELEQQVPHSYSILSAIRCHQLGELLQDFYVDQWPEANVYVGILQQQYYTRFKTPPYQILHFYGRTNDARVIQDTFNALPIEWNVPILISPGANEQQVDIIIDVFRQHAGVAIVHEDPYKFFYATSSTVIKPMPVPEGYEFVRLNADDAEEIAKTWVDINNPFVEDDIATLIEHFPFGGIRERLTGKLIAYGGQLHCGTSGCNRVDPEHRGKKLFQVLLSKLMPDCIERYGFATADILGSNAPSIAAYTNLGFKHQEGHFIYWLYMHPSASGPCRVKW